MNRNSKYEIDMCNGPLFPKLIRFALPLIFSGILQLLFNAADMAVVGKYAGKEALGAVGSTGSLINLLINVFSGLSVGVNVIVARFYAAHREEDASAAVHTSVTLALVCGVFLSVVGIFLSEPALKLMGSPEDVLPLAAKYMRIYFAGMPIILLYNFGSSILRAIGDTIRPLFFLMIAGVINVGLNLLFVICFGMDVDGVATATVISQAFSAVCIIVCLMKSEGCCRLHLNKLSVNKKITLQIARIGIPAGLQSSLFSISNVLIQSSINSFGSAAIAGNTAAANLEGFVHTSMNSFHQAAVSFVSQNTGAGKYKRILKTMLLCLGMVGIIGIGLCQLGLHFAPELLGIYIEEAEQELVIPYGLTRMGIIFNVYFTFGMMDVLVGGLRGMGHSFMPTIVSLIGICGFRIFWIFTVYAQNPTLKCLYLSYPISWISTATVHLICFIILYRKKIQKIQSMSLG